MNNENEIRVVSRQETFNDLAVRELAKGRAACICKMQFGRCEKTECPGCSLYNQYKNCYHAMNDYDRQRLASYVGDYYLEYSYTPEVWMNHDGFKRYMRKWILLVFWGIQFMFFILMLFGCSSIYPRPNNVPLHSARPLPETLETAVTLLLEKSQAGVRDFDGDGKINCIDYTLSFKLLWDYYFDGSKHQCQIIRNYNPPAMNHLFVAIQYRGKWYYIEPWTKIMSELLMEDVWPAESYNPAYNIWGETEKWLGEIKPRR